MRVVAISTAILLVSSLALTPAYAGQKGNAGKGGPKTTTAKAHGPSVKATKTPSAKAATPKTVKADAKLARAETKAANSKNPKKATTIATEAADTTSTSTTTPGSTTTSATTIDFTAAPNGQKLSKNSALRSKLQTRLEALGYTGSVYEAAYGFRNLGQFVAATNAAQNHTLSFEQLKIQMTGLSVDADGNVLRASLGTDGKITMVEAEDVIKAAPTKSLGQAIKTLNSSVDSTTAANTATTQAETEIATTSVSQ